MSTSSTRPERKIAGRRRRRMSPHQRLMQDLGLRLVRDGAGFRFVAERHSVKVNGKAVA